MVSKAYNWSPELAYIVGLIATDGCLSSDGRHIDFTSKDLEQIHNFKKILNLTNTISTKSSGSSGKRYYRIQFGDVSFYKWLQSIGLTPNKTKTIGELAVPKEYFVDFLRGHLDGDGCTYSYYDPRWPKSFLFYTTFISASKNHMLWLASSIEAYYGIYGKVVQDNSTYRVRYAKIDSL